MLRYSEQTLSSLSYKYKKEERKYTRTYDTNIGKFRIYILNGFMEIYCVQIGLIPTETLIRKLRFSIKKLRELDLKFKSL